MADDHKSITNSEKSRSSSRDMVILFVISALGFFGYGYYKDHDEGLSHELKRAVADVQKTLPREISPGLILFRVSSDEVNFFYDNKFTNLTLEELNKRKLNASMPDSILPICKNFEASIKQGANVHYRFFDKSEIYAHEIVLNKAKCNY